MRDDYHHSEGYIQETSSDVLSLITVVRLITILKSGRTTRSTTAAQAVPLIDNWLEVNSTSGTPHG